MIDNNLRSKHIIAEPNNLYLYSDSICYSNYTNPIENGTTISPGTVSTSSSIMLDDAPSSAWKCTIRAYAAIVPFTFIAQFSTATMTNNNAWWGNPNARCQSTNFYIVNGIKDNTIGFGAMSYAGAATYANKDDTGGNSARSITIQTFRIYNNIDFGNLYTIPSSRGDWGWGESQRTYAYQTNSNTYNINNSSYSKFLILMFSIHSFYASDWGYGHGHLSCAAIKCCPSNYLSQSNINYNYKNYTFKQGQKFTIGGVNYINTQSSMQYPKGSLTWFSVKETGQNVITENKCDYNDIYNAINNAYGLGLSATNRLTPSYIAEKFIEKYNLGFTLNKSDYSMGKQVKTSNLRVRSSNYNNKSVILLPQNFSS